MSYYLVSRAFRLDLLAHLTHIAVTFKYVDFSVAHEQSLLVFSYFISHLNIRVWRIVIYDRSSMKKGRVRLMADREVEKGRGL